jgi:hypothetical protein
MTKKKNPKDYKKFGRPTVFTPEVLQKLEQGFKIGLTDTECCCYADVNLSTLYEYQKRNPEFLYKKEKWKQFPIAKAKNTIFQSLDDPKTAQWYLERKCKEEFSTQSKLELESKGINIVVADEEHRQMLEDL